MAISLSRRNAPARPNHSTSKGWCCCAIPFRRRWRRAIAWAGARPGRFQAKVEHLKFTSSIATATLPQLAIAEFLATGGYEHHLRNIRRVYADQIQLMTEAIARYFPAGTKVTRPQGGHVLWVEMPAKLDSLELFEQALAAKISIAPGPLFSAKKKYRNCIRLNCASPWSAVIEGSLKTLGMLATKLV